MFDATGGQTKHQAVNAVREGDRVISRCSIRPSPLGRGITGESFAARANRERLEALRDVIDAGKLHAQI